MSKYKFKITYRNENGYGQYWGDNRYTVSIIAETLEQAKQKLDEIEKNECGMHKSILEWEAEEIIEEKDKEIERLNNIINELEEYIKRFLYMLNGITDRDVYEQCQLDDFTMIMEKLQELKGVDKE